LPSIPWLSNGGVLIWALLAEVQKTENRKVLFGPAPGEGRIGSIILPEEYKTHPGDVAKRVKGKAEELFKTYKIQAKHLRVTGGGIGAPGDVPGDGVHVYQLYHIPEDGPHHDTPQVASNLWEQISEDFPYFAELHKFLCTRPNIIPPVVTTGVGPLGHQVVHHQQPDPRGFDKNIDPNSVQTRRNSPPSRFTCSRSSGIPRKRRSTSDASRNPYESTCFGSAG
ncbi:hypothetical protein C8J57DRAFT_1059764, partial [Mycena rebaudengoi]